MMGAINLNNYEAYLLDYFEGNLSEDLVTDLKVFVLAHPELEIDLNDSELLFIQKEELPFDLKSELKKSENEFPDEIILNYIEGNLSASEKLKVDAEAYEDYDLARNLEIYKKTILPVETDQVFNSKQQLIKTEDDLALNNRLIAYVENQLSAAEKAKFEAELKQDQNLQKELSLFKLTQLKADTSIVYPDKESLKKEGRVVVLFNFRIAASIAAAILLLLGLVVVFKNNSSPVEKHPMANNKKTLIDSSSYVNENAIVNPEINFNNSSKKTSAFVAEKPVQKRINSVKKDTVQEVTPIESNNIANQTKNDVIINPESKIDSTAFASNNTNKKTEGNQVNTIKYSDMNMLAVAQDDEQEVKPEKNNFWKRAVKFAQQVNGLGVNAVKGDDKDGEAYSLSFNSFSVEKK